MHSEVKLKHLKYILTLIINIYLWNVCLSAVKSLVCACWCSFVM